MEPATQAIFFGLAIVMFAIACVISLVRANPPDRFVAFDWHSLGLGLATFVFFWIALKAA